MINNILGTITKLYGLIKWILTQKEFEERKYEGRNHKKEFNK